MRLRLAFALFGKPYTNTVLRKAGNLAQGRTSRGSAAALPLVGEGAAVITHRYAPTIHSIAFSACCGGFQWTDLTPFNKADTFRNTVVASTVKARRSRGSSCDSNAS